MQTSYYGRDGRWESLLAWPVRFSYLCEPALSCRGGGDHREIIGQQEQARLLWGRRSRRAPKQQGFAQPFGKVWREPSQVGRLGERKMGAGLVTGQAHEAPAGIADDEHGTQFVSKGQWSQDLTIAPTLLKFTPGCLRQVHNWRMASGQPDALIHIILREFILDELGHSVLDGIVKHCPREEERRRINGAEAGKINGDHGSQPLHDFDAQRKGVESSMTEPDQLTSDAFRFLLLHGASPALVFRVDHGFLSIVIIHAAQLQNHPRNLGLSPQYAYGMLAAGTFVQQIWRKRKGGLAMLGEENKALARLFSEEFWNKGNMAAVDELMATNAKIFLPGRGQVGLNDLKAFAVSLRGAFPDWYATTDEIVAEEKRVAERWTGQGTHRGTFQGIAPTGRQVTVPGTVFYRFASGKITEFRGQLDGLTLMQQLGVLPDHR